MDTEWTIPPRRMLKRKRKEMRDRRQQSAHFKIMAWDEDATQATEHLRLDARTFKTRPIFNVPAAKLEQIADPNRYIVSPSETFAYQNRVLHGGSPLKIHGHGDVRFNDDVVIPLLIDLHRDKSGDCFSDTTEVGSRVFFGNVWMSLTPNEIISQRRGIELAKGTVVVGGLGLGWFVRKVCEKSNVEQVIVIDQSQELLDWCGYKVCSEHPKVSNVICDDIYNQIGKHGDKAVYLLDIWPIQEGVNCDSQFKRHKSRLGDRLWGWGWRPESAFLEHNQLNLQTHLQLL